MSAAQLSLFDRAVETIRAGDAEPGRVYWNATGRIKVQVTARRNGSVILRSLATGNKVRVPADYRLRPEGVER